MQDPNLEKIKEANMYSIKHGRVRSAINQAENYLSYILRFNLGKINQELDIFIKDVKTIRRSSRGQKSER